MNKFFVGIICTAVLFCGDISVESAPKKTTYDSISEKLDAADLQTSLSLIIKNRTASPRYFEKSCDPSIRADNPLYPNIPYKECSYKEGELNGWVQLAVIPPVMLAGWITDACKMSGNTRRCVARLAAYIWESNQFSFPISGNIIENGRSAGASDDAYLNLVFLHGVTIPLPASVPQRQNVPLSKQREVFSELARTRAVERPAQVSRPAGVRREIYLKYADAMKDANGSNIDVGLSCPLSARKMGWLEVSRRSLVEAWNQPSHKLIAAAAIALEKGDFPGRIDC